MTQNHFDNLCSKYNFDCAALSFIQYGHPAFRELQEDPGVIGMIIKKLRKDPHVFLLSLMSYFTGAQPFADRDRGKIKIITHAWIDWGTKHGY